MTILTQTLELSTRGQGMHEITGEVVSMLEASGLLSGTVTLFCQHTSCSLMIMENADPSAKADLECFLNRLIPEDEPYFTHILEGADDMPSHIKMALTRTSEVIPFDRGVLCLGTWQGIFLWEHRRSPHRRRIILSFQGV